jgi:hypothetical protein
VYQQVNGVAAPPSICAGWVFCDEDAGRAEELARKYIGGYWHTVLKHYELRGDHLMKTKGYESYGRMQELASAPGGAEAMIDFFLGLQVWGTPERCYQTIVDTQKRLGSDRFVGVFSYAGMPAAEGERNMRVFARTVLPELNRYQV